MNRPFLAGVAFAAASGVALAFPPRQVPSATPAPPPMPLPADRYEFVVLAPHRPIRIAVRVEYQGKPLADRWAEGLKTVFAAFDRDTSGDLNATEVRRAFSDTSAAALLQNGFYSPFPNDVPTLAWLDADRNGRVSFAEFTGYYRQAAGAASQAFPPRPENAQNAAATEELFKLLDRDQDGRLTRAEVSAAESWVVARDADEDECLSLFELVGNVFQQPAAVLNGGRLPAPPPEPVAVYRPGAVPDPFRVRVLAEYDPDVVARLWAAPADVDVTLSFAPKADDCRATVTTDPAVLAARGFAAGQPEPGRVVLRHGRQPIELVASTTPYGGAQLAGVRQQFLAMFDAAAKGAKHLTDADLGGPNAPQYQLLRVLLGAADADADGKLTRPELEAHLALFTAFGAASVALTPGVQTPTLFQLLDGNRDGRLSVRELRTAWDRLAALEPPAGGPVEAITRAAIVPSARLQLTRPAERLAVFLSPGPPVGGPPAAPQPGPVWFRKMDRNGDGDVSRAEFLGTRAEFAAMDADRDGLISHTEAEAFAAPRKE